MPSYYTFREQYTRGEKQRANNILKRMLEIPQNEMMMPERYVSVDVVKPVLAKRGAICQGHQACAIGSLMLAAGQEVEIDSWAGREDWDDIYGSDPSQRRAIFKDDGGCELAFRVLNDAADDYADAREDVTPDDSYEASIEALFEGRWPWDPHTRTGKRRLNREMIKVIEDARTRIRKY